MKTIEIENIWDFHVDLINIQQIPPGKEYLLEQIDVPTATHVGGFFSAICQKPVGPLPRADEPQDKQLANMEDQIRRILSTEGLSLVLSDSDIEGTGRQVLHAEGIYFIRQVKRIEVFTF